MYEEERSRATIIAYMFWCGVLICVVCATLYHFHALKVCKENWRRQGLAQSKMFYYDFMPENIRDQMDEFERQQNKIFRESLK